jgi:glycosyltransferase 2 family protein
MSLLPGNSDKTPGREPVAAPSTLQRWGYGSWQLWVSILFSLGFLWLALRGVDLRETAYALGQVNVLILAIPVASYVLSTVAKAIRWRLLLSPRTSPSLGRSFSVLSIGVMVNTFLPARLGDFVRAYLMGEAEADSKVYVLGTVVVEKVSDLILLLLSLIVLLSQMALPAWLAGSARGMALVLALLLPCLVLLVWQRDFILRMVDKIIHFIPTRWQEWMLRQTRYGLSSLDVLRRPRLLLGLFGWSLIIWIVSALTNYLVFWAMGLKLPFFTSLLLLVVLQVGTAVPSSPGRIGVFQYLVILTLSIFALDKNVALVYSIILYFVIYVPIVLMGGYCLWREKVSWKKLVESATMLTRLGKKV